MKMKDEMNDIEVIDLIGDNSQTMDLENQNKDRDSFILNKSPLLQYVR